MARRTGIVFGVFALLGAMMVGVGAEPVGAASGDGAAVYGLGGEMSSSGAILPSIGHFSSDEFTGSATVGVGIDAPPGLGGLTPGISLSYSSASVNAMRRAGGGDEHVVQGGLPGYGWNIGGLSYIVDGQRHSTMVLNGTSVRIDKDGGTSPHLFAKVERRTGSIDKKIQNPGEWIVTGKDGTKYFFGVDFDDPDLVDKTWSKEKAVNQPIETLIDFDNQSDRTRRKVVKYLLREVRDPSGNRMFFSYAGETGSIPDCSTEWPGGDSPWSASGNKWYHRSVRPTEIVWSTRSDNPAEAKLKMVFGYGERNDDESWDDAADCHQAQYSSKRLTTIKVKAKVGSGEQLLREYRLSHTYAVKSGDNQRLLMNKISQHGASGGELHSQSFGYSQTHTNDDGTPTNDGVNGVRLTSAAHSWGGKTEFDYKKISVAYCKRGRNDADWANCEFRFDKKRAVVSERRVYDGIGGSPVATIRYNYFGGLERFDGGVQNLGHDRVEAKVFDGAGQEVSFTKSWFHQRTAGQNDEAAIRTPDAALGRSKRVEIWQRSALASASGCEGRTEADGRCLMSKTESSWEAFSGPGQWSTAGSYDAHPLWVRPSTEKSWADTNTDSRNSEVSYGFENTYGNLVSVKESADGALQRESRFEHAPNTTNGTYIVDRVSRSRLLDANGKCLEQAFTEYDGRGLPTETHTQLEGDCAESGPSGLRDEGWASSGATYNASGRPTVETTYGAEPSQDLAIKIDYDAEYGLFPVTYTNSKASGFTEQVKYYGVNGQGVNGGYWGAAAEFCDVAGVCARQTYDEHGRAKNLWAKQAKTASWGPGQEGSSTTQYSYFKPNTVNQNKTFIALEWHAPRSEGNFTRTHYNGLGQVVMVQSPLENWTDSGRRCAGQDDTRCEVATYFAYDALGNQTRASTPSVISVNQNNLPDQNWWTSNPHQSSSYDVLGRPVTTSSPNGETDTYSYMNREASVTRGEKVLSWQKLDGLGRMVEARTYNGAGGAVDGQITLDYDGKDRLTKTTDKTLGVLSTAGYDLGGRQTFLDDADLGRWTSTFDRQGRTISTTDARGKTVCHYYQAATGRPAGLDYQTNGNCATQAAPADYDVTYEYDGAGVASKGKLTKVSQASGDYSQTMAYTNNGLLASESVTIGGANTTYTTSYGYEPNSHRPRSVTYPDGEVVTTTFNAMGLPAELKSDRHGTIINGATKIGITDTAVNYDEAGRRTQMRMIANMNFWRIQHYHPWKGTAGNGNGRLKQVTVGHWVAQTEGLDLNYEYDQWGNISKKSDSYNNTGAETTSYIYDKQNRLVAGQESTYSWQPSGNLSVLSGSGYSYGRGEAGPHAVTATGVGASRKSFDYDANGNMTSRSHDGDAQTLEWDHRNRLSAVKVGGNVVEQYRYNEAGIRIKKSTANSATYYPTSQYEQTVTGNTTSSTSYYFFGGDRVAMRKDGDLTFLHADLLGSTIGETDAEANTDGTLTGYRKYGDYGTQRDVNGDLSTDHDYTGQKRDATGLMYYNARYYDPELGTFISPDTLVPDPANVYDYNRYMYVRGNPINNNDPTGHQTSGYTNQFYSDVMLTLGRPDQWGERHPRAETNAQLNVFGQVLWQSINRHMPSGTPTLDAFTFIAQDLAAATGQDEHDLRVFLLLHDSNIETMIRTEAMADAATQAAQLGVLSTMRSSTSQASQRAAPGSSGSSSQTAVNSSGAKQNCASCAIVGDRRLANGTQASSIRTNPDVPHPNGLNQISLYARSNGASGNWVSATSQGQISRFLLRAGNGTRAIVHGQRADGSAHVWNATVQNGQVNYVDFQSGGAASFDGYAGFSFVRTTP